MLQAYFKVRRFLVREDGQGMTEYGLIIALVAIVLIVALGTMTGSLEDAFEKITDTIDGKVK